MRRIYRIKPRGRLRSNKSKSNRYRKFTNRRSFRGFRR